nr:unnamed protein product [Spirometra erinaceieuropaei]
MFPVEILSNPLIYRCLLRMDQMPGTPAPEPETGGFKCGEDSQTCVSCTDDDDECSDLSTCQESCGKEAPEPGTGGFKCDEAYNMCVPCTDEEDECSDLSTCEETCGNEAPSSLRLALSSPSTQTTNSDRPPEPSLPSSSSFSNASTPAVMASASHLNMTHSPDTTKNTNIPTDDTNGGDQVYACP